MADNGKHTTSGKDNRRGRVSFLPADYIFLYKGVFCVLSDLRFEVRLLKILYGVSYAFVASAIGIKSISIYKWLCGDYELSQEKEERLRDIIRSYHNE